MAEPEPQEPGTSPGSSPARPLSASTVLPMLVAAGVVVSIFLLRAPAPETPPPTVSLDRAAPPSANTAAAPAPSSGGGARAGSEDFCDRVVARYEAGGQAAGCPDVQRDLVHGICRIPFDRKPDCLDEMTSLGACIDNTPPSGWACDTKGSVMLAESACLTELNAFTACIK